METREHFLKGQVAEQIVQSAKTITKEVTNTTRDLKTEEKQVMEPLKQEKTIN